MTLLVTEYNEEFAPEELAELGSFNHSYLQAKLTTYFFSLDDYMALTELSLDASSLQPEKYKARFKDSIKPDIAVYPKRPFDFTQDDILKMTEMPLLAIEILSPMQGTQILIDKVKVYFALGVRSCWLVYPAVPAVSVYTSPKQFKTYSSGNVIDTILSIQLPITEIFG